MLSEARARASAAGHRDAKLTPEAASTIAALTARNLGVNSVRVTLVRPPSESLKDTVVTVAAGATSISLDLTVNINGAEETLGTTNISVTQPQVQLGWHTIRLGIGQYIDEAYASLPDYAASDIQVNFSQSGRRELPRYRRPASRSPLDSITATSG
jgi:hypothetical protein